MSDTTYNGWTNWSTWNIALWVDNEEWMYKSKIDVFKRLDVTAKTVKEFCIELFPNGTPDMEAKDLKDIDWDEIAENWQEEMAEYE